MATPPDRSHYLSGPATNDVARGSRIQPDGSDMRKSQPWYRDLGKAFHLLASVWVVGPVRTPVRLQGVHRGAAQTCSRQRILSIVFDVELIFLARKRGYVPAIVSIRWSDKRARGCGPGQAWPCALRGTCSGSP
jgi:hypothetical protein